jgi:hypothetical protein
MQLTAFEDKDDRDARIADSTGVPGHEENEDNWPGNPVGPGN